MNSVTPTKPACPVDYYGTPSRPDFHGNPEDVGLFYKVSTNGRNLKNRQPRPRRSLFMLLQDSTERPEARQQEPGMPPQYPSNWRYGYILAVDEETGRSLGVVQGAGFIEKSLGYWPTLGLLARNVNDAMHVRVPRHGQGPFCVPVTHHDPDAQAANPYKLAWRYLGIRYVQQPATHSTSTPDPTDEEEDSDDEERTAAKKKQKTSEATSLGLDTWALAECGESKPRALFKYRAEATNYPDAVASSRIWSLRTREDDVEELCLTWLENDGGTSELGAYVPCDTARTSKISIFRCADFDRFGEGLKMKRVRFVFIPDKTSKDVVVPMMLPTCSDVAGPSTA
ncbi:hypothetical protein FRC04_003636 [Tulasnella sp. 424]|nr:hypothetical protein FRC04_003636 [Tulasnella sp. 424]KAG8965503.1 hypothetical protein FRC05_003236 [Tulasnella sp. 425]